jgi:ATP-dependent DNA helicase PIF1
MFTKNGNLLKGVINGATTIIKSIIFDPQNNVTTIEVQLTNNSTKMTIKKHSFQHKYTYDGHYYKISFIIVVTYIMIGHKSQNATIATKVVIDIKESFTPNLIYVMLSKVTN